jgi:hypothetical protein
MTRRQANLLIAAGVWTIYVWISFMVIQSRQHDTSVGFKVVHGVLALISVAFGIAIGVMGSRARRTTAAPSSTPASAEPVASARR